MLTSISIISFQIFLHMERSNKDTILQLLSAANSVGSPLKDVSDLEGVKNSNLIDLLLRGASFTDFYCIINATARNRQQSINQSSNQSCIDVNSCLAKVQGSIEKKHSEFHVEDSGNIRNRHAMPNFKGKGRMYDETNK